ncbi:MAG: hypothetical protein K2Y32_08975 [Candidatus Obscuribacterales bacterium]|nr:hypothetical protein [Candidatus Obscuribacterales bacterium]
MGKNKPISACFYPVDAVVQKVNRKRARLAILQTIEECSSLPADALSVLIFELTMLALSDDPSISEGANGQLERLFAFVGKQRLTQELSSLERVFRTSWCPPGEQFSLSADLAIPTVGLMSLSRNGYLREAAVRRLIESGDCSVIPFLLLRLRDWVLRVRELALDGLRSIQQNKSSDASVLEELVHSLPLLFLLEKSPKCSASIDLITDLCKEAVQFDSKKAIVIVLSGVQCSPWLAKLLLEHCLADSFLPLLDCDDERIAMLSFSAIKSVCESSNLIDLGIDDFPALLRRLFLSKHTELRVEALRSYFGGLFASSPDELAELAKESLFSERAAVRALAQYLLKGKNIETLYRARLQELRHKLEQFEEVKVSEMVVCLSGMKQFGLTVEDEEILEPFLMHGSASVRAAAFDIALFQCLNRGQEDQFLAFLYRSLEDGSGKCIKVAIKHLNCKFAVDFKRVAAYIQREPLAERSLKLMPHLSKLNFWQTLSLLLLSYNAACLDGAEDAKRRISVCLDNWLRRKNSSFVRPKQEAVQRAQAAFNRFGKNLSESLRAPLEALLAQEQA